MKRIISLIAIGIAYVTFVAVFSLFNNNEPATDSDETTQNIYSDASVSLKLPWPPPPPPPPAD